MKLSLSSDDMIIENNKESAITKLLQVISDCIKAVGLRLKHKNQLLSYISTMNNQETKNTIQCKLASKKMKRKKGKKEGRKERREKKKERNKEEEED